MYIDSVILFSLVTVGMICFMMGYIGWYAYRQIQKDIEMAIDKQRQLLDKKPLAHPFESMG